MGGSTTLILHHELQEHHPGGASGSPLPALEMPVVAEVHRTVGCGFLENTQTTIHDLPKLTGMNESRSNQSPRALSSPHDQASRMHGHRWSREVVTSGAV
jgi:hypothetical protein